MAIDRPIHSYIRRNGNTTRLVDYYIQKLFEGTRVIINIEDHYLHIKAHEKLIDLIERRITIEHKNLIGKLEFDKDNLKITWL